MSGEIDAVYIYDEFKCAPVCFFLFPPLIHTATRL